MGMVLVLKCTFKDAHYFLSFSNTLPPGVFI